MMELEDRGFKPSAEGKDIADVFLRLFVNKLFDEFPLSLQVQAQRKLKFSRNRQSLRKISPTAIL
ncbi:MAG: hypothetical protein QMD10_10155 [Desulfitobacteriaceae bacterium]|nr:hypothetical protein [Desulfitobacteriaceae bacterium]